MCEPEFKTFDKQISTDSILQIGANHHYQSVGSGKILQNLFCLERTVVKIVARVHEHWRPQYKPLGWVWFIKNIG